MTEGFYIAHGLHPDNRNVVTTLQAGVVQPRIYAAATPPDVVGYLCALHNRFHHGASFSWLQQLDVCTFVFCILALCPSAAVLPTMADAADRHWLQRCCCCALLLLLLVFFVLISVASSLRRPSSPSSFLVTRRHCGSSGCLK
jgi:hypothetical protein